MVSTKPLDGWDFSTLLLGGETKHGSRELMNYNGGRLSVRTQTHRLDAVGGLFDMVADPNQKKDIAAEQPELAAKLAVKATAWHEEIFGSPYAAAPVGGKGKGSNKGGPKNEDKRPYPVGYSEFPITMLPARDGEPHGGVQRSSSAPNCSYFVNWKTKDASMTWDIDVHTAGEYEASIEYVCPQADVGSMIVLSFGDAKTTGKVIPGWYPRLLDDQDRAARKGESYMRDFHTLSLGTIKLAAQRGLLTLRALEIPGQSVAEVLRVTLTLKSK